MSRSYTIIYNYHKNVYQKLSFSLFFFPSFLPFPPFPFFVCFSLFILLNFHFFQQPFPPPPWPAIIFCKIYTCCFLRNSRKIDIFQGIPVKECKNWIQGQTPPSSLLISDITVVFLKSETSSFLQSSSFVLYFIMYKPGYNKTPQGG